MKRFGLAVCAALLLCMSATPPAADATSRRLQHPHCATHDDYRNVYDGYTIARTARIMGHYGHKGTLHRFEGRKAQNRGYPACEKNVLIAIVFTLRRGHYRIAAGEYKHLPPPFRPHCATQSDFDRVKHGMTVDEVKQIMGHAGTVTDQADVSGYRSEDRTYQTCGAYQSAVVGFSADPHAAYTEDAKSGYFG